MEALQEAYTSAQLWSRLETARIHSDALREELDSLTRYHHRLLDLGRELADLPPEQPSPHPSSVGRGGREGDREDGLPPRVAVLLDRDNRGQKFLDDAREVPAGWTLHVVYNPVSKHKLDQRLIRGDARYFPAKRNETDSNAAVLNFVAGRIAAEFR
eukprot:RCo026296